MTEGVYHKGALLQVVNPFGFTMYKNAKLAQLVFHELKDKVRCALFLSSRVGLLATAPPQNLCHDVSDVISLGRRIFWCLPEHERNVMEYGLFQCIHLLMTTVSFLPDKYNQPCPLCIRLRPTFTNCMHSLCTFDSLIICCELGSNTLQRAPQ